MNIRSVVVGFTALIVAASFSFAAGDPNAKTDKQFRGQNGDGQRQTAMGELNLTEEQKMKIGPIRQQMMEKVRAVRNDANLTPDQKRERISELRKQNQEEIKKLFTPEQQKKMEQLKSERGDMNRPPMGHSGMRPGGPMAERMNKELGLTEEQQAKIKSQMEKRREQAKAIMEDKSLSPDQRREKLEALRKEDKAEMDNILTAKQKAEFEKMRVQHENQMNGKGKGPQKGEPNQD